MSNIVRITGQADDTILRTEPNEELIEELEKHLADARSGRLQGYVMATLYSGGESGVHDLLHTHGDGKTAIGLLEWAKHRILLDLNAEFVA